MSSCIRNPCRLLHRVLWQLLSCGLPCFCLFLLLLVRFCFNLSFPLLFRFLGIALSLRSVSILPHARGISSALLVLFAMYSYALLSEYGRQYHMCFFVLALCLEFILRILFFLFSFLYIHFVYFFVSRFSLFQRICWVVGGWRVYVVLVVSTTTMAWHGITLLCSRLTALQWM